MTASATFRDEGHPEEAAPRMLRDRPTLDLHVERSGDEAHPLPPEIAEVIAVVAEIALARRRRPA